MSQALLAGLIYRLVDSNDSSRLDFPAVAQAPLRGSIIF